MIPQHARGALQTGSVGVMGSGRLVWVTDVEAPYRAYLVTLPDQPLTVHEDFYSFLIHEQKAFTASPFIRLEPVTELSERNKHFMETGIVLPGAAPAAEVSRRRVVVDKSTRKLIVAADNSIIVKYPQYHAQFHTMFTIVLALGQPTEDQVIAEGKVRGLWAGAKGQDKALHWCVVQLLKAGRIRWV